MMELVFSGCHALVLGASSELGICLSRDLIEADIFPVLTCRNETGIQKLTKELSDLSGKFKTVALDFTNDPSILKTFAEQIGCEPDFLIDLAQPDFECLVGSALEPEIFEYFAASIAFRAACLKQVVRLMLKNRQGRLVYVSSTAAARATPGQGFYAAAKCATGAIYRNIGLEMGSRGVTTVTLRPGYIDAGRGRSYAQQNTSVIRKRIPTRKILQTKQVVETIMFLLSDSASGFNATEITMDGGMSAGK